MIHFYKPRSKIGIKIERYTFVLNGGGGGGDTGTDTCIYIYLSCKEISMRY